MPMVIGMMCKMVEYEDYLLKDEFDDSDICHDEFKSEDGDDELKRVRNEKVKEGGTTKRLALY